ncbi:MAG: filamentous hemagglutinin N-terminal domain-containing protein, partial [Brachymonas sp.]|nr:filamentous hemagglutinin N-terminal domain-containing protein [Brachymonas sp.]
MNKQHRIIFNKARGQYMAVAECAQTQVKGGPAGAIGVAGLLRLRPLAAGVAAACLMLLHGAWQPAFAQIVADPSAPGQQRATVLKAPNEVPLVNIQTPSAAGVSRNTYSQFDVNREGAILNNSRKNVQTQLGGWVQGNPWLARGEARVILTEVNSNNPSQLRGYLEVAGQKAELVIANPAGIAVNGGGFINASRVTLSTGAPQLGADGAIKGYAIERGTIRVDGLGLDATLVDYTGLLARAVEVNAGIWAKELGVVSGTNTVAATAGAGGLGDAQANGTPADGSAAPRFALDVSALGGMYAGKITLIGTEAGVGVRNAGSIAATAGAGAGQVHIDTNGLLTNTGVIGTATANQVQIHTHGQGLHNSGTIASQGVVQLQNAGHLRNSGVINARRELQITADQLDNLGGTLTAARLDVAAQGLNNTGRISQSGPQAFALQAHTLRNAPAQGQGGWIGAEKTTDTSADAQTAATASTAAQAPSTAQTGATIKHSVHDAAALPQGRLHVAGALDNSGGHIVAHGLTDVFSQGGLVNSGTLHVHTLHNQGELNNAGGQLFTHRLAGEVQTLNNRSGLFYSHQDLSLRTQQLDNVQGVLQTAGTFTAQVQSGIDNRAGQLLAQGDMRLSSPSLNNAAHDGKAGFISSHAGQLNIEASQSVNNQGGVIQSVAEAADKTLSIRTADLNNAGGTIRQNSTGAGQITASQQLNNAKGQIASQGSLNLQAQQANNRAGQLAAQGDLRAQLGSLGNAGGQIQARGDVQLQSSGAIDNQQGQISAQQALRLNSAAFNNQQGQVVAAGSTASLRTGAFNNVDGLVQAGQNASQPAGHVSLQAKGGLDNTRGTIRATHDTNVQAQSLNNTAGRVQAGQKLSVAAHTQINNVSGYLQGQQGATLQTDGSLRNDAQGQIASSGFLRITAAGGLSNLGSSYIGSHSGLVIQAAGISNSDNSTIQAGSLNLNSADASGKRQALSNHGGTIVAAQQLQIDAGGISNSGAGRILTSQAGSSMTLRSHGYDIVNQSSGDKGGILSAGSLTINTQGQGQDGTLHNSAGYIGSGGVQHLTASRIVNTGGQLSADADMHLTSTASGADAVGITNDEGGQITSRGKLAINAASRVSNQSGTLVADGAVQINTAAALNNQAGKVLAGQGLNVAAQNIDNRAGQLLAQGDVQLQSQTLNNAEHNGQAGLIASNTGQLNIDAEHSINNQGGVIQSAAEAADKTLSIRTVDLNNASGSILQNSTGSGQITASKGLNNTQGQIATQGSWQLQAGDVNNSAGHIAAQGQLKAQLQSLSSNTQGKILSRGTLEIASQGVLNNTQGQIASAQSVHASGADINNRQGLIIAATGDASLHSSGAIHNQGGSVQGQTVAIQASGALDNSSGHIQAASTASVQAQSLANTSGRVQAGQALNVTTVAALNNRAGQLTAGESLNLQSGAELNNQGGTISSAGSAQVAATQSLGNQGGQISSAGAATVTAAGIDNSQGTLQAQSLSLSSADTAGYWQGLNNHSGTIAAQQQLQVDAGGISNTGAGRLVAIQAGSSMILRSHGQDIANHASGETGGILSAGTLDVDMRGQGREGKLDNTTGYIGSGGAQRITAGLIHNNGGTLTSDADMQLHSTAAGSTPGISNAQSGRISVGGNLTMQAASDISNRRGKIVAEGDIAIQTPAKLDNAEGEIFAGKNLLINGARQTSNMPGQPQAPNQAGNTNNGSNANGGGSSSGGTVSNEQGTLSAQGDVSIAKALLNNQGGTVQSGKNMVFDLIGDYTYNVNDVLKFDGALYLNSPGTITNHGLLEGGTAITVKARNIQNEKSGTITSGGNTTLQVQDTLHNHGWIKGQHVRVEANALANYGDYIGHTMPKGESDRGYIVGEKTVALDIKNTLVNQGGIDGKEATGIRTPSLYNFGDGFIIGDQLYIKADTVDNGHNEYVPRSALGARKGLHITAKTIDNHQGNSILSREGLLTLDVQNAVNNWGNIKAPNIRIDAPVLTQHEGGYIVGDQTVALDIKNAFTNRGGVDGKEATAVRTPLLDNIGTGFVIGSKLYIEANTVNNRAEGTFFNPDATGLGARQGGLHITAQTLNNEQGRQILSQGGKLMLDVQGTVDNKGAITGPNVHVKAADLHQHEGAVIVSGDTTAIDVKNTVNNRGAIAADVNTAIRAQALNNVGTGRIYGDQIAIAAHILNNLGEGSTTATLNARERLDIGAHIINNQNGSRIASAGHLAVAGALDDKWQTDAATRAEAINNHGSHIEAARNMALQAQNINNSNAGLVIEKDKLISSTPMSSLYQKSDGNVWEESNLFREEGKGRGAGLVRRATGESWREYLLLDNRVQTVFEDRVLETVPGIIKAGYNISLNGTINNTDSQVMAGLQLHHGGGDLNNVSTQGTRITKTTGQVYQIHWRFRGKIKRKQQKYVSAPAPYEDIPSVITFSLPTTVYQGGRLNEFDIYNGLPYQPSEPIDGYADDFYPDHIDNHLNNPGNNTGTPSTPGTSGGGAGGAAGSVNTGNGQVGNNAGTGASTGPATPGNGIMRDHANPNASGLDGSRIINPQMPGAAGAFAPDAVAVNPHTATGHALDAASGLQTDRLAAPRPQGGRLGAVPAVAEVAVQPKLATGHAVVRALRGPVQRLSDSMYLEQPHKPIAPLFETDPLFTNHKTWLSSDYMLNALGIKGDRIQKRLGDGYYEQHLINNQVGRLTGRTWLSSNHQNADEQYRALMNAGIRFAQAHKLRPGIALTAEQMAQLTSSIVWLEEGRFTLQDGSVHRALAPRLYAIVSQGQLLMDLSGSGGLISAGSVIHSDAKAHTINNQGGALAAGKAVVLEANNIRHESAGRIQSDAVQLSAQKDITISGSRVEAGSTLLAQAGGNITIASTTRSTENGTATNGHSSTLRDRIASLSVNGTAADATQQPAPKPQEGAGPTSTEATADEASSPKGKLILWAGQNISLHGAEIANRAPNGLTHLQAGNIELGSVWTESSTRHTWNARNYLHTAQGAELGSRIVGAGHVELIAQNDLQLRASEVDAQAGRTHLQAGRDIQVQSGHSSVQLDQGFHRQKSSFWGSNVNTSASSRYGEQALASQVGGQNITLAAGQDLA